MTDAQPTFDIDPGWLHSTGLVDSNHVSIKKTYPKFSFIFAGNAMPGLEFERDEIGKEI